MPKKITTSKTSNAVVSEQLEEIVVAAPVVEQPEVKIQKKAIVESESEVETDKEEVNAIDALITELTENIATMKELTLRSQQDLKKLVREIQIERKKAEKGGKKKEKKVRNGTTGLDNELKVVTSVYRQFVEMNYQQLKDSDDNQIVSELKYDSDGSLLISRKMAHKFVNSYVKLHKLQYEDNGRRIHMDKTLQKLFPDNAEKKEKGVVTREENFYFTSVMKAISPHLASATNSK
jgi:Asp-tRNA(Asn)/Glu-tRNA(Gln) amidotransferase A subunit family amidase